MTRLLTILLASSCLVAVLAPGLARAEDSVSLIASATAGEGLAPATGGALLPPPAAAILPDPATAVPVKPAGPDEVELAALYYYAAERQAARVEAETARLRAKYPGFVAPADLYLARSERKDEAPLWALYEKDDFDGIERLVATMKTETPGYEPSADFKAKLERRKLRFVMTRAYEAKDWIGVIAASAGIDPASEKEADLLYMMIDGYRAAGNGEALLPLYRNILFRKERLPDPVLVTTLRKAVADFPVEDIRAAIASLWADPARVPELIAVNDDILRRDFAAFNADETRTEPFPPRDVERMRNIAKRATTGTDDLSILGWYFLKMKDPRAAEPMFRAGYDKEKSVAFAKGLYLSLAQQGKDTEAYQVAPRSLDQLSEDPAFLMNALSLRFAKPELGEIDPVTVSAYSKTILATKAAAHGEILAWYAFNSGQYAAAEAWFAHAYDWEPKEERIKGIALAYLRQNKKKAFANLRANFEETYPELFEELLTGRPRPGSPPPSLVATVALRAEEPVPLRQKPVMAEAPLKKTARAVAPASTAPASAATGTCRGDLAGLSGEAARLYGWCALKLDRVTEARQAFAVALSGKGVNRQDAAYGAGLAALRARLTDEAEAIVSAYPMKPAQDQELRAELYFQRARAAFDRKDYAGTLVALNARIAVTTEPADLTELRGWSYYHLGQMAEARAIFARLNMRFGEPGTLSGLNAARETMRVR